ncbi:Rieske (2Fe-2S) protein [Bradyrhizobium sp. 6(2017)]|uniref:Rieske (2Fe-2S) protein n=1 Tax=Bradyrhizobium sp. 6(2017) TaxID=1197460 RepID=UPI001FEDEEC9|nr:Rieske 2Fe-2S domain-containing protein [Bradyrhizobium sp. 6(2017)]
MLRTFGNDYFGYVNRCPHDSAWLNIGSGEFFSPDRSFLRCGRHGARFEIDTGVCIDGPCNGQALEPVALTVIDGDVCLRGASSCWRMIGVPTYSRTAAKPWML